MQPRIEQIFKGIIAHNRVAGAYLFLGPPGVGKRGAAQEFAQLLECSKQDKIEIRPEGATLKIGQIRELQKWVRFGPSAGKYLAVIVEGADSLTGEAAAAFLKTLEEPAPGVVFMLLVERSERLPDTILSRCQRIIFPENQVAWEMQADFSAFYQGLEKIKQMALVEVFKFSSELEKEKEQIEQMLYDLAYYARYKLQDIKKTRVLLDSVRFIKRRANLKLTLDSMCLRLAGGINDG